MTEWSNGASDRLCRRAIEHVADEGGDLLEELERDESADHEEAGRRCDQIRESEFVAVVPTQLLEGQHQALVGRFRVVAENLRIRDITISNSFR